MGDVASGQFVDNTIYNPDTFDVGDVKWSARRVASTGWLRCDGSAVSRTTYADLFAAIAPDLGAVTVTIASPGVFTLSAHGFVIGDRVYLTTTGALPTGLSANTLYYVVSVTTNTFTLSASEGGSAINTTGSQSGAHHVFACAHGLGDGTTTFNLPDAPGRTVVASAGSSGSVEVRAQGQSDGVALANRRGLRHRHGVHTHTITAKTDAILATPGNAAVQGVNSGNSTLTTASTDGGSGVGTDPVDGGAYLVLNCFIKHQSAQ